MSRQPLSDPTAGESAQLKRLQPEVPQPIFDPTDPRYGATAVSGETVPAQEEDRGAEAERRL